MIRTLALVSLALALNACASPSTRIDAIAERAGLAREVVAGMPFRHVVYTTRAPADDGIWTIYLEGDGLPWIDGRLPATDPTTRDPLALHLMAQSAHAAIYIARPCYQAVMDPGCSWQSWTHGRYSDAVVSSMTSVIETKLRELDAKRVRFIGYSGGGVLAVLIAERLRDVDSVITIGANLDVDAWATHHNYLSLSDSLNPARSDLSHPWREVHLQGGKDEVVPPTTTRAYFERYPQARSLTFHDYDHVCCWRREWSAVLKRAADQH